MNFFVVTRKSIVKVIAVVLFLLAAFIWYSFQAKVTPAFNVTNAQEVREIHLVTGEFTTSTEDGEEIEAYRFDPGTINVKTGEQVRLKIFGVNGEEHPFSIEGTNIQGTIMKGKETVVPLQFDKPGTYRLICHSHQDYEHHGPMIAYIVVSE
ncbi:cupredoxin domain-containing protein [Caldibacillus lycopersici]|uniref:Cupredoxin domain-containing protein n=1 Tax=Perspicuibacillus lycopersici TaxID=1325689 RepID=A0AAE3LMH2_9BACI|nr:cupredoxin domain-containing protein [Perspicuibacillus lycopersici]MCU9613585.1 cupredoxin domain-containing protein [Perspicuibacillus lycopersici]